MGLAESAKKWFNYPIDPIIRDTIKRRPLYYVKARKTMNKVKQETMFSSALKNLGIYSMENT